MKSLHSVVPAIILIFIFYSCFGKETKNIRSAVLAEVKKYPKLEIQDLYKLAYQAAMGNVHIMSDTAAARKYLETELASVDTLSDEPLVEYLTSDSSVVRINLRAVKKQNYNPKKLFEAMIQTATSFKPSDKLLREFWNDITELADEGRIPFEKEVLAAFFTDMKNKGFPVMHHSEIVNKEYHPAYRVVSGKIFDFKTSGK